MTSRLPVAPDPVVGYVRVSQVRDEMISPEIQQSAISAGAAQAGRVVAEWIIDLDATGRNFTRDVQEAIGRIEAGPEREIWVYRFDRWGRNATGSLANVQRVENAGGRVVSATEPFDAMTAIGKYTRTNAFALAEMQSDIIGENWAQTHAFRIREGLPASGGPRFGYALLGRVPDESQRRRTRRVKGQEERYVPDEAKGSEALAQAYRSYLAGKGFHVIANDMNAAGWRTTAGRRWRSQAVRDVLDAGFGAGLLMVHDPTCSPCNRKAKCPQRAWLPGAQPPVISPGEWQAYRDRRALTRPLPPRSRSPRYALTGLTRCGHCRSAMAVSGYGGDGQPLHVCTRQRSYKDCPGHPSVTEKRIMAAVREHVSQWAADIDAAAEREAARLTLRAGAADEVARLENLLAEHDRDLVRLATARARDTLLGDDAWAAAATQARAERDQVAAELEAARGRVTRAPSADLHPVMAGLAEAWDTYPATALSAILRALIRRVTVYRDAERRRNSRGHWEPAQLKIEVLPVWEPDPWEGEKPHVGRTAIV